MVLICPSCETAFRVDTAALGPAGRDVRCARCQTVWFAGPLPAIDAPPLQPESEESAESSPAEPAEVAIEAVIGNDIMMQDEPVQAVAEWWADSSVDPLEAERAPAPAPEPAQERRPAWEKLTWRGPDRQARSGRGLALATAAFVAVAIGALVSPGLFVRALPELASLYAAAGISVNLRGLEFREVRTRRESHDGIALLVTEGEIVNVSGRELELPRIRLAAMSPGGRELYAWTAAPARERLAEGEVLSFKSRLASPPADARQVQVRFLARGDQAWSLN